MIDWKPFSAKALDFIQNSDARLNICEGSVRSSKTVCCSIRWLAYIADGPQGDLAMLGRTMATLQRNVLNDIFDIVGPKNYKWVSRQQGEIQILGRRIFCFGANNEDAEAKIRGATFAGALCDEVGLYPKSVFNQLMARLSVENAKCFCNTNPDSPYHWFYTDFIKNDRITSKKIWHFVMEDNLSLSQEYIEGLKSMYTGVWYDRMIAGKWVVAEGRIYDMFNEATHMVNALENLEAFIEVNNIHPRLVQYLVACDYGTSTVMSWGLYAHITIGRTGKTHYWKLREYYYDAIVEGIQQSDEEFVSDFKHWCLSFPGLSDKLDISHVPSTVYCDPSASSWKVALSRRQYRVMNANNDVLNGIRYVGSLITQGCYVVDKSCVNTLKEYSTYSWDIKAQKTGIDRPIKAHDHTCDTDRYALYTSSLSALTGVYNIRK